MVVGELSVGRVVGVDVYGAVVDVPQAFLGCVLKAAHAVVVFEYVVEGRILVDEDVDGFVADELHFLC